MLKIDTSSYLLSKCFSLLTVFFISMSSFSSELVFSVDKEAKVLIGDSLLVNWELNLTDIKLQFFDIFMAEFKSNTLNQSLYLSNIRTLSKDKKSIKGLALLTLVGGLDLEKTEAKIGADSVPIKFQNIKFELQQIEQIKGFSVIEEILKTNRNGKYLYLVGLYLILFLLFSIPYIRFVLSNKRRLEKRLADELRQKDEIKKLLTRAEGRDDIEKIYKLRRKWINLFDLNKNDFENFFLEINRCQYKKSWSSQDETKVKEELQRIKDRLLVND